MKIAIAWYGLPYYAARCIAESIRLNPGVEFSIISTQVGVPYEGIDDLVGGHVHWIAEECSVAWSDLGGVPDLFITTSWSHKSYMGLAKEAKAGGRTRIVSMVDNFYIGTSKQWLGALYFRIILRHIFDLMWVPGARGTRFMRFLGMPSARIVTGLYAADTDIFYPPDDLGNVRKGVVFVGQFIPRKGVHEIVDALQSVDGEKYRDWLRLIGHGPLLNEIKALGLRVEEFKQPRQLGDVYRSADALLLPSKIDHWGVVAHEAALCGCLILATRQCACVDDLVTHEVNGYIMSNSSSDEILAALTWLDGRTCAEKELGRLHSIERAAAFSPKRWAETLKKIILDCGIKS